jgi:hypothetical protein
MATRTVSPSSVRRHKAQTLANDATREGRKVLRRYFPTEWLSRRRREPVEQSS